MISQFRVCYRSAFTPAVYIVSQFINTRLRFNESQKKRTSVGGSFLEFNGHTPDVFIAMLEPRWSYAVSTSSVSWNLPILRNFS